MARKLGRILLIALAVIIVLLGIAYIFRDPLATRITASMLDRSKEARCTHPEVRISSSFRRVTVSPFACEYESGTLKSLETESDVVLWLRGLEVTHVFVSKATMEQRERDTSHVESNTIGDVANIVGIRDGLVKGMLDASEAFKPGGPIWEADTLVAKRDGKVESVMKGFRRTYEDGWERQHAERMEGSGDMMAMRDFDLRVNKSRAKLSLDLHFGKPKRGDEPDIKLKMEARGLDEKTPYVSMSL